MIVALTGRDNRAGVPIRSFRRAWITACKRAGIPGRIPHDFRRTAVRNLERAGVPRSVAMKLVGHTTEAIYRRYAIADESMLREAAAKLAALHDAQRQALRKVYFEGPLGRSSRVPAKSAAADATSLNLRGPQLLGKLGKKMVGRDGIEPPTPGFSVLIVNAALRQVSRQVAVAGAAVGVAPSGDRLRVVARRE
jgi:hypothetical protein